MIDNASGLASLGYSVAVDLKNRSNKQSCNGGSDWFDVYNKDGSKHTYLVAIAPWTTGKNCDTTATSGMLKEMTTWILDKAQEEHLSAWCSRYDNGGSWHADVRFLKWEDTYFCHQNIWDIPCQST
ncbi:CDA_G0057280.mRNA.1.CDS.1 [Saccharomyces cerevisiae]|nr:CDA_G0057280.mRNA.1.CDS.1 [Saccharomyces cerevisiae]CAI7489841.1 CDA_G0057280.mRNA.1.CDS.1 [Saccharomyces cerevisiae]